MADYYERHRASVHRGTYPLAVEATDLYEHGRVRAAQIVGGDPQSTILVRNTTEAINLVAYSWGRTNLRPGDEVVVTEMEHHSNLVPWQLACEATGAELHYVPVDDDGELVLVRARPLLRSGHVRMVAVAHVSNVLGTINPIADIAAPRARRRRAGPRRRLAGRAADGGRPARARLRLLRLDRPQGLRADRHRRAPRPPRAARRDAAVPRRRPHDLAASSATTRPGRRCRRSSRPARRRSPRRSASPPRSTSSTRSATRRSAPTSAS